MTPREQVVLEAMSWLGTPYHHCADVKGAGVDCLMLLVCVYRACGLAAANVDPRPYSPQWHLHRSEELYLQGLGLANATETTTPQAGDIAVYKFGYTFSHAGILVDQHHIIHALKDSGAVTLHRLNESPLAGRDVKFFSVVEG